MDQEIKKHEIDKPRLEVTIRTLFSGGFILDSFQRNPDYKLLFMYRDGEFGVAQHYCFAIDVGRFEPPQVEALKAELSQVDNFCEKEATQAQVRTPVFNYLYDETTGLPIDA